MLSLAGMLCRLWRCGLCGVVGQRPLEEKASQGPEENQGDDLTVIRGIGIASQNRLYTAGIKTYAALAGTPAADIRRVLGNFARGARVEEWIAQARDLAGKESS